MGQQQGRDEALKFILPSRELELNLQPLYRVYDPFFCVFFLNVSQSRCWRKVSAVVVEVQRKSVCISRVCLFCSLRMYLAQVTWRRSPLPEQAEGTIGWTGETGREGGGSNTSVQICSSAVRPQLSSSSAVCWSSSLTCVKGK